MTTEPSGISLSGGINAPAATTQLRPIRDRSSTIAPFAIMLPSPTVQPCRNARWPIVTFAPTTTGTPGSVWMTVPSCTFEPAPISIHSVSPRNTQLNQTLAPASSRTQPMTSADGAT